MPDVLRLCSLCWFNLGLARHTNTALSGSAYHSSSMMTLVGDSKRSAGTGGVGAGGNGGAGFRFNREELQAAMNMRHGSNVSHGQVTHGRGIINSRTAIAGTIIDLLLVFFTTRRRVLVFSRSLCRK